MTSSAIVVFSHLRWGFCHQRPQHLLTRLAAHYPVVFIEEPVYRAEPPFLHTYSPAPGRAAEAVESRKSAVAE